MKVFNIFSLFFFALTWVWKVDVVYVWFGGYHGFFPVLFSKLLGKKSIVIVGGYDASYVPSLRYGVFYTKGLLLWVIKSIYRWATYICPVDESLVKSTNYYADPTGVGYPTGILNHMFLDEKKIKVLPTGYDPNKFFKKLIPKKFDVISVGFAFDDFNFRLKGFDLVLEVAKLLPDLQFAIVGLSSEFLEGLNFRPLKNVILIERVDQESLIDFFSSSRIVLQLSLTEGLPNALCEAMLCECIPIGSNVNGIPKAIGGTGYLLDEKNKNVLRNYIIEALIKQENAGFKARQRICELFPLEKRIHSLKSMIEN